METVDVIVAGGGIIGLSAALELARAGHSVRVLERGQFMCEASWAAAGMLAAEDPENPAELTELARLSKQRYPEFLRVVEELSGQRVPLRTRAALLASATFHPNCNLAGFAISGEEAALRVPGLATKRRSFLWIEEMSLDPRDLCVALPRAAEAAGVALRQETAVLSVVSHGNSVEVTTRHGRLSAGAFVNCCGAWSGQIQKAAAAVGPWKGQMHTVALPAPLDLPCVLRTPEVYLVPRGGGRIVVGATVERAGFDRQVEPTADAWLRVLAAELWPPITSGPVVESWTGLRPGTRDGLPLIGSAGEAHCWIASGHFRNGILLAPATALLIRQLVEGRAPEIGLGAFLPGR